MKKLVDLALFALLALAMVAGAYNLTHSPATMSFDGPPCRPDLCPPPPSR